MKFSVVWRPSVSASASPWRVLDERGREVAWANTFLDAQRVRQLSLRSLRPMLMTCCTSHVGGRNARRCRKPPNLPCSIMPVTNWINSPNPRRKP